MPTANQANRDAGEEDADLQRAAVHVQLPEERLEEVQGGVPEGNGVRNDVLTADSDAPVLLITAQCAAHDQRRHR